MEVEQQGTPSQNKLQQSFSKQQIIDGKKFKINSKIYLKIKQEWVKLIAFFLGDQIFLFNDNKQQSSLAQHIINVESHQERNIQSPEKTQNLVVVLKDKQQNQFFIKFIGNNSQQAWIKALKQKAKQTQKSDGKTQQVQPGTNANINEEQSLSDQAAKCQQRKIELMQLLDLKSIDDFQNQRNETYETYDLIKSLGENLSQQKRQMLESTKERLKSLLQLQMFFSKTDRIVVKCKQLQIKQQQIQKQIKKCEHQIMQHAKLKKIQQGNQCKKRLQKLNELNILINQRNFSNNIEAGRALPQKKDTEKVAYPLKIACLKKSKISCPYKHDDKWSVILNNLGFSDFEKCRFYYVQPIQQQQTHIKPDQLVSKIVHQYQNILIRATKIFQVEDDFGKIHQFDQGISLQTLLRSLRYKFKTHCFFTSQFRLYTGQYLKQNLKLREYCLCQINYIDQTIRDVQLPLRVKSKDILKYIQRPFDQNVIVCQVLLFQKSIPINQNQTIIDVTKGFLPTNILITHQIELKIEIIKQNFQNEISMKALGNQTFFVLKKRFQKQCQLKLQQQSWKVGEYEIQNHQTLEKIKVTQNSCRIKLRQLFNLQFYGFRQELPIKSQIYNQFYIQDDQQFVRSIEKSDFPDSKFQYNFRISVLQIIFAAVKKHCRIDSAIAQIKRLVRKSEKKNFHLWMPKNAQQKIFFNQNYALNNILLSADQKLKIQFMRINKNHNPLPLLCKNSIGETKNFLKSHFWIANKGYCILSIGFSQKVKGKSFFLNKMFNTQFQISNTRHPVCAKAVTIKYNIYRNQRFLFDLIDVSSESLSQDLRKQLLSISSVILLQYLQEDRQQVLKFVKQNKIQELVVLIQRDANQTLVQKRQGKFLEIYLQQLNEDNLRFNQQNGITQSISNQLNIFVKSVSLNASRNPWRLLEFLSKQSQIFLKFFQKLKQLQEVFSQIIDLPKLKDKQICQFQLHLFFKEVFNFCQNIEIQYFMSKIRQFSRLERALVLSQFQSLHKVKSLLEIKSQDSINKNIVQITQCINNLQKIPKSILKNKFIDSIKNLKTMLKNKQYSAQKLNIQQIDKAFNQVKQKQFSIQNFWRTVTLLTDQQKNEKKYSKQIKNAKRIYALQFANCQSFQIINGDNLKMPLNLLKSNESEYQDKKTRIIGIFGKQSSGKSTLLNFLFGCDFMSSDGRCTNGVYGTYYDVAGKNIPNCQGIFILDTEGLFGNYKRENTAGRNFDNKLVLFLIKVCDILILNTIGDIDSKTENILQLSFDSQLIGKEGANYPNFYVVLNKGSDSQIKQQQIDEISQMRRKILGVCPQMENYLSSKEAVQMPNAFVTDNIKQNQQIITTIQKRDKTPTRQFYRMTKHLSLQLMNILIRTGRQKNARNLGQIYQQMDCSWSAIIKIPLLTKYASRLMKNFESSIKDWKGKNHRRVQTKMEEWRNQGLKHKLKQIVLWQQKIQIEYKQFKRQIIKQFNQKFPKKQDPQINNLTSMFQNQLEQNIDLQYRNMKVSIAQQRYKLDVEQSKDRGVHIVNLKARQFKRRIYTNGQSFSEKKLQSEFQRVWTQFTQEFIGNIDSQRNSKQLRSKIQDCFNIQLQRIKAGTEVRLNQNLLIQNKQKCDIESIIKQKSQFFQSFEIQPIIVPKVQGATQLKRQYLDMTKFFEFQKSRFNFYFKIDEWENIFKDQCHHILMKQDLKQQKNVLYFVESITKQFQKLRIQLDKNRILKNLVDAIIKNYTNSLNSFKNYFKTQEFNCTNIIKNIDQTYLCQQKIITLYHSNWGKSITKKYSVKKGIINKNDFNIIIIQKFIKKLQTQLKDKTYLNTFYQYISKVSKQIIKILCHKFIQKNTKQLKQWYNCFIDAQKIKCLEKLAQIGIKFIGKSTNNMTQALFQSCPIQIDHKSVLTNLIQKLPNAFNKQYLNDNIHQQKLNQSICIAFTIENKITIKSEFKDQKTLKVYMNKEYRYYVENVNNPDFFQFIKKHIKTQLIFERIDKKIKQNNNQKMTIQNSLYQLAKFVQQQIRQFNLDLRQICKQLTINFKDLVYNYTAVLVWAYFQKKQQQQNLKTINKLQKDKQKQKTVFLGIVDKNPNIQNQSEAQNFIHHYQQFMSRIKEQQKRNYINKQKKKFLGKFNRKQLQKVIDMKIFQSNSEKEIYQYLKYPDKFTREVYYSLVQDHFIHKVEKFQSSVNGSINQLLNIVSEISQKIKNTQQEWDSQDITNDRPAQKTIKRVFQHLLTENPFINHKTQCKNTKKQNAFNLKEGFQFTTQKQIIDTNNRNFFINHAKEYVIPNYTIFLKFLIKNIKNLKEKVSLNTTFEYDDFKNAVIIDICSAKCPCCGKLCDIDVRNQLVKHTVHKCISGHQMRAVNGIRVEKREMGNIKFIASVMRCQDIPPMSKFSIDGSQKAWSEYCDQMKNEWSFKPQNQKSNQVNHKLYSHMWEKCGRRICQQFQSKEGQLPMQFVDYTQQTILMLNKSEPEFHYIFMIDGSGSMSGDPWNKQLKQLRQIINQLCLKDSAIVSIVHFNSNSYIQFNNCILRKDTIDLNKILFKGGQNDFQAAMQDGIKCMKKKGKQNIHMILISDGQADNPKNAINELKNIKSITEKNSYQFNFTTIHIGMGQGQLLIRIADQMGGQSKWITDAGQLSKVFREVMGTHSK